MFIENMTVSHCDQYSSENENNSDAESSGIAMAKHSAPSKDE